METVNYGRTKFYDTDPGSEFTNTLVSYNL
jgi:hypothetical protein